MRLKGVMAGLTCLAAATLAACQAKPPPPVASGKSPALAIMEQVAIAAHKCWFASKDPEFRAYRMANELNSFSGRPRFLLVPAANFEGRPLLVVQAEGTPARLDAFGPLLQQELAPRISGDLKRWAGGNSNCTA